MIRAFRSSVRMGRCQSIACVSLALIIATGAQWLCPSSCIADSEHQRNLFNNTAVQHADAQSRRSARARLAPSAGSSSSSSIQDAAHLDTVDDILFSSAQRQRMEDDFHGIPYVARLTGNWDASELDEDRTRAFAQKLMLYQASQSFDQLIKNSDLESLYQRFLDGMQTLRTATTVQVGKASNGQYRLSQSERGARLLEFHLRTSPTSGVQPELNLTDRLRVRYDLMDRDTMLEFRVDF